jgi:hypothetical protein
MMNIFERIFLPRRKLIKTFEKKIRKLKILFISTVAVVLLVAVTLILYFALRTSSEKEKTEGSDKELDCTKGHEQYSSSSISKLGKFKKAAIAADSVPCATIGKYKLKNVILILKASS